MGSWGTAIFADDLAADVRDDWRDAILAGEEPGRVTQQLIDRYGGDRQNDSGAPVFWLALAAAQLQTGRLDVTVRDRALEIIDTGADLVRWGEQGAPLARRRERVLERLAQGLRGPAPKPKRLKQPQPAAVTFDVGDVVCLNSSTPKAGVLAIVVSQIDGYPRGTRNPVVELLICDGDDRLPASSVLAQQQCVLTKVAGSPVLRPHLFVISTPNRTKAFGPHIGKLVAHGVPRPPAGDARNGAAVGGEVLTSWTTWDGLLHLVASERFRRDVQLSRS